VNIEDKVTKNCEYFGINMPLRLWYAQGEVKGREFKLFYGTDIYRKPTATDTITPADSCHQLEQKVLFIPITYLPNK
jgi:hypothetical protein